MSDTLHKQKIAATEAQNECEAAGEHDAHAFARPLSRSMLDARSLPRPVASEAGSAPL